MSWQQGQDLDSIPMQQFNPAFVDTSLERRSHLPMEGTQYEFAHYGHPDQPETRVPTEGPHDLDRRPTSAAGCYTGEIAGVPTEGPHVLHRRHTSAAARYGENEEDVDETAMENLLKRLPSRRLESATNIAAKTLHRRHSRKKSMYGTIRRLEGKEELIDDMIDSASLIDAAEEERMEEVIRSMPSTMAARRTMIRKLSSRKKKAPSFVKRIKYRFGMGWKHFKDSLEELKYSLELWHSHLKKIEGNFGTDVLSYFVFLKWLLLINIPTLLLTLGFLVVPQILFRWFQQETKGYVSNEDFTGKELLTGAGWFSRTELYYGYYTYQVIQINSSKGYRMQLAYIFTCGGYYLLTLVILGHSILRSYRKYYIEASGLQSMQVVFKVLGGWDFGLTSSEAVKLKRKSTYHEFKEYLAGVSRQKTSKSLGDSFKLFWLRFFTNFVVLALLGGAGYLVYFLSQEQESFSSKENPWLLMVLPVSIGGIHMILPFIFTFIENYEQYQNPRSELYMHLLRSMVLRLTTLTVLVYYWYTQVATNTSLECWESFLGQELYRLVIVDFIFDLLSTFFSQFVRRLFASRVEILQHPAFNIGRNTLELIYSQALCWLGTFYAPLLSFIVMIKLILIFYVKMISVLQNCKPSERPWRATRSHTIFLGILFLFFLCTSAAVGCGIIFVKPSSVCGPYKGKDVMYSVVPELVDSWEREHPWLSSVVRFASSPGFIAAALVVLGMGVYLVRTAMIGRKEAVQRLKQQLELDRKDKSFLLNLLYQVSQRQNWTTSVSGDRPLTQNLLPNGNTASPGGRVFARRLAEGAAGAK